MKLEGEALWAAMDVRPSTWHQTTRDMFYAQLEAVEPKATGLGAFLVGEPAYATKGGENVYACFRPGYGEHTARYMTIAEFNDFLRGK